jgi:hypothetical protein
MRIYVSQCCDGGTSAVHFFEACTASPRSRVNSGHCACAWAWLQNPASVIAARTDMCVRIMDGPSIGCHRRRHCSGQTRLICGVAAMASEAICDCWHSQVRHL